MPGRRITCLHRAARGATPLPGGALLPPQASAGQRRIAPRGPSIGKYADDKEQQQ